jgi:hypothetical protein
MCRTVGNERNVLWIDNSYTIQKVNIYIYMPILMSYFRLHAYFAYKCIVRVVRIVLLMVWDGTTSTLRFYRHCTVRYSDPNQRVQPVLVVSYKYYIYTYSYIYPLTHVTKSSLHRNFRCAGGVCYIITPRPFRIAWFGILYIHIC